jgi:hypothetical protein
MEKSSSRRTRKAALPVVPPHKPLMSLTELAQLGGGKVAYIKVMSHDEAKELFPAVENLPEGIDLYSLHAADGTPLVLTDSRSAAVGHAIGDELEIAAVH